MVKIRETITVNGWTITLFATKCVLAGDWSISARDMRSGAALHPDWFCEVRHPTGVAAMNAGRDWIEETFGEKLIPALLQDGG